MSKHSGNRGIRFLSRLIAGSWVIEKMGLSLVSLELLKRPTSDPAVGIGKDNDQAKLIWHFLK